MNSLQHRGPDHQGIKSCARMVLGHCRLSVIDLSSEANQPFSDPSGRYHLVFNGEIYNYQELRSELESHGVHFHTQSDTEVLLHLLMREGEEALTKLNGFFALAFYDETNDDLLLVRDRFGIKPLLYSWNGNKLIFSSELRGFIQGDFSSELAVNNLNYYFGLTYFPLDKTVYKEVLRLLPGELIRLQKGKLEKKKYYQPVKKKELSDYEEAKKELRRQIELAVDRRLVADVPVGCFLSGGLDSSIIAAVAKSKKDDLRTFSVGFDDDYFNETEYALATAEKIGSQHTLFTLTRQDFQDNFDRFLNSLDEPFADSSAFAVFLLSEKVKNEVTVALSGDGADELFGGYRKHRAEWMIRNAGAVKKGAVKMGAGLFGLMKENRSDRLGDFNRKLQKLSSGLRQDARSRYVAFMSFISFADRAEILLKSSEFGPDELEIPELDSINDYLRADQSIVLPGDMLKKVDITSMAHALEVRVPFLDHEVVELANRIPDRFKLDGKQGKKILADAFADLLPEKVLNREKKGFEVPIHAWLGEQIQAYLNSSLFSSEYLKKQGIFKEEGIRNLMNSWNDPKFGDRIYMVWALIVFQTWYERNRIND